MMRRDPAMSRDMASGRRDSQVRRAPNSAGLYDVLDLILDKGIVIDAFVRVSLVGIELLTVDLRVVIASVDTYLRYAEGVERLQVYNRAGAKRLPDMVGAGMKTAAIKKGAETVGKVLTGGNGKQRDDDEEESSEEGGITGSIKRGVRNIVGKLTGSDDDNENEENAERRDDDDQARGERRPAHKRDADRPAKAEAGKAAGARR